MDPKKSFNFIKHLKKNGFFRKPEMESNFFKYIMTSFYLVNLDTINDTYLEKS